MKIKIFAGKKSIFIKNSSPQAIPSTDYWLLAIDY
jgi:hypothetical protein